MQQVVRISGNVPWQCFRTRGEGNWIGICEPLKITLQAETWLHLMEDIGSALDAILKEMLLSDELIPFLRDRGWALSSALPNHPEDVHFDVPFIPAVVAENGFQRKLHQ